MFAGGLVPDAWNAQEFIYGAWLGIGDTNNGFQVHDVGWGHVPLGCHSFAPVEQLMIERGVVDGTVIDIDLRPLTV